MRMKTQPTEDHPGIINGNPEALNLFLNLVTEAAHWSHKHKGAPDDITNGPAQTDIIKAFFSSDLQLFQTNFKRSQQNASQFYRNPDDYWKTIALGVSTQDLRREVTNISPPIDREKYFPNQEHSKPSPTITPQAVPIPKKKHLHKRGELWKIDTRWERLWPSSHAVFMEILRRTQYPKRPDNFPWCQAGVNSLAKFTNFSPRQIQDALSQLERFKLIKRIVKGNQFQGCSKYLVFIIPKMSGAFTRKFLRAEKNPPSKKRIPRMS